MVGNVVRTVVCLAVLAAFAIPVLATGGTLVTAAVFTGLVGLPFAVLVLG